MKYLITYDLNSPGQNYESLYKKIKSLGDWNHSLQNTWFVYSQYSVQQIRDQLKTVVGSNDKIFVCTITDWAAYGMSDEAAWLNSK